MSRTPRLESLEDRRLLAAYTVDTLNDVVAVDGLVSLREALESANNNSAVNGDVAAGDVDGDTIDFAASLSGGTISLSLGQLFISDDVTIDGSAGVAGSANHDRWNRFESNL